MRKIIVLCLLPLAFLAQAAEKKVTAPPTLNESKFCYYNNQYWTEGSVVEMAAGVIMQCKDVGEIEIHLKWERIDK
ncbi:hypothetical protein MACH09_46850 [Vibrio sp. MACH09]|uniref:DUF1496 domain-containing protein n=1 Tax=Vibrio sp. MACH09 TaxID=3025122 RepID=UPI002792140B|nr:DUF1496 domain-containing protein [Vibrio sp. MACH09]GLO64177.1 hypothetical protein MACH09_46850 [Vibrio sp. MACH09]